LDSRQFKAFLVVDLPRAKCEMHGTQQAAVPWAEKHGRFTALVERLPGSRQLWLRGFESLRERPSERVAAVRAGTMKTARAWSLKESFRALRRCRDAADAPVFLKRGCTLASQSRLDPTCSSVPEDSISTPLQHGEPPRGIPEAPTRKRRHRE